MKIQNKKSFVYQKRFLISAATAVLLGVGAFAVIYSLRNDPPAVDQSVNNDESTKTDDSKSQESSRDDNLPEGAIDTGEGKPDNNSETTESSTTPGNESSNALSASITSASQHGSTLQVRVLIREIINTGTCTITLEKNGTSISRDAGIQPLASSSTCQGFDISTAELSSGEWNLKVIISTGDKQVQLVKTVSIS